MKLFLKTITILKILMKSNDDFFVLHGANGERVM
jgi:hypothetical protein